MKKIFILIILILVFFQFSTFLKAQDLVEDQIEIETSIVLLTLFDINKEQVYKKDNFFELFYFSE